MKFPMLKVGSIIERNGLKWRVGSVGYVGERYYWLVATKWLRGVVDMVPAVVLRSEGFDA